MCSKRRGQAWLRPLCVCILVERGSAVCCERSKHRHNSMPVQTPASHSQGFHSSNLIEDHFADFTLSGTNVAAITLLYYIYWMNTMTVIILIIRLSVIISIFNHNYLSWSQESDLYYLYSTPKLHTSVMPNYTIINHGNVKS